MCDISPSDFKEVKNAVAQNNKTLRGGNGVVGLVTTVELVRNDVAWIRTTMEKNNKSNVTWRWIVDKFGAPIIVAIIVSVIMILGT